MNGVPSPFLKKAGQRVTAARFLFWDDRYLATNLAIGLTDSEYSPLSAAMTTQ